jgi:hypothetical protein
MDPDITKDEYVLMWKNNQIESKPVIKSNYVKSNHRFNDIQYNKETWIS